MYAVVVPVEVKRAVSELGILVNFLWAYKLVYLSVFGSTADPWTAWVWTALSTYVELFASLESNNLHLYKTCLYGTGDNDKNGGLWYIYMYIYMYMYIHTH